MTFSCATQPPIIHPCVYQDGIRSFICSMDGEYQVIPLESSDQLVCAESKEIFDLIIYCKNK